MIEKNYLKLSNPPAGFLDLCIETYEKYKQVPWQIEMSPYHFSTDVDQDDLEKFRNFLPEMVWTVSLNLITKAILPLTHIDRKRKAALQVPIVSDPDKHFVYVLAKEDYFDKLESIDEKGEFRSGNKPEVEWLNQRYPGMPMFHKFNKKYFEVSPVEQFIPYINDTSLPHGGYHFDGAKQQPVSERWFISVSLPDRMTVSQREKVFVDWL